MTSGPPKICENRDPIHLFMRCFHTSLSTVDRINEMLNRELNRNRTGQNTKQIAANGELQSRYLFHTTEVVSPIPIPLVIAG